MAGNDRTVLVFGTFDVLHPGHRWFLNRSARQGTRLIAAVARDAFVEEWKGRPPLVDEQSRVDGLVKSGLVDSAVLSDSDIRTYGVVDEICPDVICLGHDQKALRDDLNSWLERQSGPKPEIIVFPPWRRRIYSSTRRNRVLRGAGVGDAPAASWGLYLVMILAMATFGFSWVSGKRVSTMAAPATLAFIRFALTAGCFLPLIVFGGFDRSVDTRDRTGIRKGLAWTAAGAGALVGYNLLFFRGLESGLAGNGGLIVTTLNPLFTFFIVSILGRSRPRGTALLGILVGIAGGILLMQPWDYGSGDLLDAGNLTFLAAAACWAALTVVNRRGQAWLGFRHFNLALYAMAALILIPFVAFGPEYGLNSVPDRQFWGDMLFISAATGAFGTGAYFMASMRLGAARSSAFTYLVPVFTLLFTSVILEEKPDVVMIAGGGLAIIAVMLINRRAANPRNR